MLKCPICSGNLHEAFGRKSHKSFWEVRYKCLQCARYFIKKDIENGKQTKRTGNKAISTGKKRK